MLFEIRTYCQQKPVQQFVLRYREVKQIMRSDGNEIHTSSSLNIVMGDKRMKLMRESRKGLFSELLFDLDKGTVIDYVHDATETFCYPETKVLPILFSFKNTEGYNVETRLINNNRKIGSFNCKQAEVEVNGEKLSVWYSDTILLRPAHFPNPLFKDIPGVPVGIGFYETGISLPNLAGIYRFLLLDSFELGEDMEKMLEIEHVERYKRLTDPNEIMSAFRKMYAGTVAISTVDPDILRFLPGH